MVARAPCLSAASIRDSELVYCEKASSIEREHRRGHLAVACRCRDLMCRAWRLSCYAGSWSSRPSERVSGSSVLSSIFRARNATAASGIWLLCPLCPAYCAYRHICEPGPWSVELAGDDAHGTDRAYVKGASDEFFGTTQGLESQARSLEVPVNIDHPLSHVGPPSLIVRASPIASTASHYRAGLQHFSRRAPRASRARKPANNAGSVENPRLRGARVVGARKVRD